MNRLTNPQDIKRRTRTGHTFVFRLDPNNSLSRGALRVQLGRLAEAKACGFSWRDAECVSRDLQSRVDWSKSE